MAPAIATAEVTRSGESRPTVVVTTGVDETAAVGDPTTPEPTPVPEVTAAVTVSPIAPPNAALDVSADDGDTAPDPDIDTDELAWAAGARLVEVDNPKVATATAVGVTASVVVTVTAPLAISTAFVLVRLKI
jgi:hypothetical protein